MTAKYSTDSSDATMHHDDWRHVLHQWTSKPFAGHRRRHEEVKQAIVIEYTHGVGVDIIWQARSDDEANPFYGGWTTVERIEVREYGLRHDRQPEARWLA